MPLLMCLAPQPELEDCGPCMRHITFYSQSVPGHFQEDFSDTRVSMYAPQEFQIAVLGDKYFLFCLS